MHKQDLQECHHANQLAITTLRNELERKGQKEIENLQREHQHELGNHHFIKTCMMYVTAYAT